jgi:DNA-binding winged helix-turn-helix (wHTH) protein
MADVYSHMRREQVTLPSHVVDLAADELRSTTGDRVELRPRSLAVLRLLAQNAGRLVCKNEIIAEVWDDVVVTDDSLTQCIADIRKAIGEGEHRILRTVPRRGYLLVPSERKTEFSRATADRPVIAVLPLTSTVGAKGQALGTGVASEIINELARNRDLKVIFENPRSPWAASWRLPKRSASVWVHAIWLRARLSVPAPGLKPRGFRSRATSVLVRLMSAIGTKRTFALTKLKSASDP